MISYESIGFSISRAFSFSKRRSRLQKEVQIETTTEETSLRMGWALHQPKDGQTRFSDKIRGYLQKKFDIGQKPGEGRIIHK